MAQTVDFETHEQIMACMTCGLAGLTPEDHFPQPSGRWGQECPGCGAMTVWVTEPRLKGDANVTVNLPPPSGGDDSQMLQEAIDMAALLKRGQRILSKFRAANN